MLDVETIKDDRQMLSLTGLNLKEFCFLIDYFSKGYQKRLDSSFIKRDQVRKRKAGGGRKGKLASMEQKQFFILYYLKVYPTFDVLSARFAMSRSKVCESAHQLGVALNALEIVPAQEIHSSDEMAAIFK